MSSTRVFTPVTFVVRLVLTALCIGVLPPPTSLAQVATTTPSPQGHQLLFFYDATGSRVPFLVVTNQSAPLTAQISWYSQDLSLLRSEVSEIGESETVIFDPGSRAEVQGRSGLAVVTPVRSMSDATPIVPAAPLFGGFTLADTSIGSGFGQNPLGRLAVGFAGVAPPAGAVVDGEEVRFQTISPGVLETPFFFNPSSPGLTSRFLLAAFRDAYGPSSFSIQATDVTLEPRIRTASGGSLIGGSIDLSQVVSSDISSLTSQPLSSSGSLSFSVRGARPGDNVVGLFSQSLGTFAVGQRLPGRGDATPPTEATRNLLEGQQIIPQPERVGRYVPVELSLDSGMSFDFQLAQVFTISDTGTLATVRVAARATPDVNEPLTLELRGTDGALPAADNRTVFASASLRPEHLQGVDPDDASTWPTFDFRSLAIPVSPGDRFAFSLRSQGVGYELFQTTRQTQPEIHAGRNEAVSSTWAVQPRTLGYIISIDR